MTKITVTPDCGNAPKKVFLKDFNIAFATGDADFIIDHVSDDICWEIYGDKTIQGKEQFAKEINLMKSYVADEVVIHTIITHGKEASLNGEMKMGDKTYVFCDVYRFASAGSSIIKEMHSYVIETNN
ncbi:SnoaL-like protein [Dyadobacter jejuensis]|uniref:SnoaL-like protein n=1 Tax=Dyadobacter jejuensis TaxID=1082580 RepID=A0A316AKN1_9BACT|nr:nuclear transport factor 2 family protein [Dyadobacter jejuensis]PWJ58052.1 SnoaL-like protein [Dyadobacter jejuensis]